MKYTNYFGLISQHQGQLNLRPSQFRRMMNIVHLEGLICGLNKAKDTYKDTNLYFRYDAIICKHTELLAKLTGDKSPKGLLLEMLSFIE